LNERSRSTVQKQIILDTLKSINTHPSVDELYSKIQKSHPSISKATIYRNVRQLAEKGIILQIAVANDVSRYDGCTDFHQHFICNNCGNIFDLKIDCAQVSEKFNATIQNNFGHVVDNCIISFEGTCLNCVYKIKK